MQSTGVAAASIASSAFNYGLGRQHRDEHQLVVSTKHRLLAWHVLSRGTRSSASISIPDVFVPACLTPGTTALLVVRNHPSGNPAPSPERGSRSDWRREHEFATNLVLELRLPLNREDVMAPLGQRRPATPPLTVTRS